MASQSRIRKESSIGSSSRNSLTSASPLLGAGSIFIPRPLTRKYHRTVKCDRHGRSPRVCGLLHAHPRHSLGFTLVELLVSVTLTGLLATIIFFAAQISLSSWKKAETGMKLIRSRYAAAELLNRQINSMVPYYSRQKAEDTPTDLLLFDGKSQSMRFVSSFSSQYRESGGNRLVEYYLAPEEKGIDKALWVQERLLPRDGELNGNVFSSISRGDEGRLDIAFAPVTPLPSRFALLEGIQSLKFEYQDRVFPKNQNPPASPKPRPPLPAGVIIKIRWVEEGQFRENETRFVVPINAYYEKKIN
jgi:prepilin-type N-terminal cleavage/methylation domain-containing protein